MNDLTLFKCPKVPDSIALNLTKRSCACQYKEANRPVFAMQNRTTMIFEYCTDCEIGKANLKEIGDKLPKMKKQSKVCLLYNVAPDICKSESKNGVYYRTKQAMNAAWANMKYCCPECGVIYKDLESKGLIK